MEREQLEKNRSHSKSSSASALQDGSSVVFQHYMHRKIQKQREQFGVKHSLESNENGKNRKIFHGVVVLVNGYTEPDADTIMRLMHQHGGDLEKYETGRITHIIAERLSDAKANMYKTHRKKPTPVCKPSWIIESIKANKLLPHGPYLVEQLASSTTSMKMYFGTETDKASGNVKKSVTFSDESKYNNERSFTGEISLLATKTDASTIIMKVGKDKGKQRTVGTDPKFLESYFSSSRLSFIGSYKQRSNYSAKSSFRLKHNSSQCRRVFHIDMDCFFASVVLRNYPQYSNKAVAIGHAHIRSKNDRSNSTSELSTCNYEARKYGIKKGMWYQQAKQLCPELIVLPYDYNGYDEVSSQVADIIQRYSEIHNGFVEQVSCDEFYFELHKEASFSAKDLADAIRLDIERETKCTASIGIGKNKLIAKISTEKAKPNKTFVCDNWKKMLENLKLRDIPGIGYVLSRKLGEKELITVSDVWALEDEGEHELCKILGQVNGKKLFQYCCGSDNRPVAPVRRKTIGAECNYGVRFDGPYGVDYMMSCLAKEVERRMELVGVTGKQITLKLMQRKEGAKEPSKFNGHGICNNLSKTCDIPGKPSRSKDILATLGMELFESIQVEKDDIRGMGLVVSSLFFRDEVNKSAPMVSWLKPINTNTATVNTNALQSFSRVSMTHAMSPALKKQRGAPACKDTVLNKTCSDFSHSLTNSPNQYNLPRYGPSSLTTDGNILLPSQIDDEVLHELPTDLQHEILQSIQGKGPMALEEDDEDEDVVQNVSKDKEQNPIHQGDNFLRVQFMCSRKVNDHQLQLNVKEMIDLQKLKSDRQTFKDLAVCELSMTQLSELPVSLQLDVMNGKSYSKYSPGDINDLPSIDTNRTGFKVARKIDIDEDAECFIRPYCDKESEQSIIDESSIDYRFYTENIARFHQFMDNHEIALKTDVEKVSEYLSICLFEKRQYEAILLLRSIKRRKDIWKNAYNKILQDFQDTFYEAYRYRLDTVYLAL